MEVPNQRLNLVVENLKQLPSNPDTKELQLELEFLKEILGNPSRFDYISSYLTRETLDEVEDAVDGYIVLGAAQKSRGLLSRNFHAKELREARKWIELMTVKVRQMNEKIMARSEPYEQEESSEKSTERKERRVEEERVIGFENPANKVKSKLLEDGPENLQVVTIAGMPGLGKTTLAKMVYMDPELEYEYMIRAFVYVSQQYSTRDVLLQILGSETSDEVKKKDKAALKRYVHEHLKGTNYMIVLLDDVWELEDWDALKGVFPSNEKHRCRVLITTTNARLAEYVNPINSESLYVLDFLSQEDTKKLLQWKVFGKDDFPDEIKPYVDNIVKLCKGLPLFTVLVAGILLDGSDVNRVDCWEKLTDMSEDTLDVCELIVEYLPDRLKPCFIYLGVFPPGYEIPVWRLVRLWISEGFIQGEEVSDLEAAAEQYLEELVQRNLVMVGQRRSNGKMKTCRLHNTLHEFCQKKAEEEHLFQEVNLGSSGHDNPRRLCINDSSVVEYLSGQVSAGKLVRSFLTFKKELHTVDEKHVSVIQKAFKLLKVLEFPSFSTDLSRLVLLKYLAVSSDNISSIPLAFSGLWSLQTLIVSTACASLTVEMEMWKMPNFRHFHTNSTASLQIPDTKPKKSEERSSETSENRSPETSVRIQTLCTISTDCCIRVLDRTPRLKKLGVRGDLATFFQELGDRQLQKLEVLKLINVAAAQLKLQSLPSHFPNLTNLTLMKTLLGDEDMSTLGKMEKLEVLKLKQVAFQGDEWTTEDSAFPNLVHLYIGSSGLNSWNVASPTQTQETEGSRTQEAYFRKLKTLQLNGCKNLKEVPSELAEIPSLHSIVLRSTNPELASSTWKLKDKNKNLRLSVYPIDHLGELTLSKSPKMNSDAQAESSSPSPAQMHGS